MSKLQTTNLSRRDFFKAAAGATIAVAAAGSVLPNVGAGKAFAAQSASGRADVVETRTVTGNVYVDKADTPIKKNAYLTNDGNPPFNMPTSPRIFFLPLDSGVAPTTSYAVAAFFPKDIEYGIKSVQMGGGRTVAPEIRVS